MKVTRRTDTQLIVEDRPLLITIMLGGFFLITAAGTVFTLASGEWLVGLFFAFFTAFVALFIAVFVRRVQVIFDRPSDTITFRARNLWKYDEVVHTLSNLSHARTEGYDTKRSVLVLNDGMSAGDHPVTDYSTNGPGPERITDAINAWLKLDSERRKA
ncbi:MAG: hypothetical protein AAF891_00650 [Pseudomonadota bacterium]